MSRTYRAGKLVAFCLSCSLLAGCGSMGNIFSLFGSGALMQVEDNKLSLDEARVWIAAQSRLLSESYGTETAQTTVSGVNFEDYAKEAVAEEVQRIYLLSCMSREEGGTLSEEDTAKVQEAAQAYLAAMDEIEGSDLKVDEEAVEAAYTDQLLADRYQDSMENVQGLDVDEEQARVIRGKQIVIYFSNDEEKAAAKNTMNTILEERQNGVSFTALAAEYSQAEDTNIQFSRGTYDDSDWEDAVFALEEGQTSEVLERSSDSSFVLFYMLDQNVEEMTEKNLEAMKEEAAEQLLDDAIGTFQDSHEITWSASEWKAQAVFSEEYVNSVDFYGIYGEYFG